MFRDRVKVKFKAGRGGDGIVSFARGKKKVDGGVGGNGGSIYVVGSVGTFDFSLINNDTVFKAESAQNGGVNNSKGRSGDDLYITLPIATKIIDTNGNLVVLVDSEEPKLLLKGTKGGLGNWSFRAEGQFELYKHTKADPAPEMEAVLELELSSDIFFIGFPNAGKSSILNELTNANAKVAPYAFTTLNPQLGRMDKLTLMDLPGLIEKTSDGKGLGTKFAKHTRRSKILAHFISLESDDIERDYLAMRAELENIDPEIIRKDEIVILTKTDLVTKEKTEESLNIIKHQNPKVIAVSVYDYDSMEELRKFLKGNTK